MQVVVLFMIECEAKVVEFYGAHMSLVDLDLQASL